jgi:hypothetical protein
LFLLSIQLLAWQEPWLLLRDVHRGRAASLSRAMAGPFKTQQIDSMSLTNSQLRMKATEADCLERERKGQVKTAKALTRAIDDPFNAKHPMRGYRHPEIEHMTGCLPAELEARARAAMR